MFKTQAETRLFFEAFKPMVVASKHCDIIVAPPFTALAAAVEAVRGTAIGIAAQNVHWEREGAFTGRSFGAHAGRSWVPRRDYRALRAAAILRRNRRNR